MITIVPSTSDHIEPIAANARPSDVEEVRAAGGKSIKEALRDGLSLSVSCSTIIAGGEPIAMFGCAPSHFGKTVGTVWLLGTPKMDENKAFILRRSVSEIERMHKHYEVLFNFIDARNTISREWLRWCGFEEDPDPQPYGLLGLPFHLFTRTADV